MGASLLLSPYGNSGDPTEIFDTVPASPGTATILGWLSLIVGLTLIPGVIATGWAALQGAPRLATAALLIAVPGWSAGLLFPSPELMASALDAAGVERATAVAVLTSLVEFNSPALAATVLIFVVAHIGGTVLLGLALYRARVVPTLLAILLVLAQPLHFVAFVVLQNTALDVTASWLTALGFGAAGWTLIRHRRYANAPCRSDARAVEHRPAVLALLASARSASRCSAQRSAAGQVAGLFVPSTDPGRGVLPDARKGFGRPTGTARRIDPSPQLAGLCAQRLAAAGVPRDWEVDGLNSVHTLGDAIP